jgi:multiple sugar transport system permease protein
MKKLHIKFNYKKFLNSEVSLKLTAIIVSTIFAGLMLYPLLYTASNSMKDINKIYDLPPKLLPDSAKSLSIVIDYTDLKESDTEELKQIILKDNVLTMFGLNHKLGKDSVSEIKVYGTQNGKTIFYSRAHQIKLQMERDYGIYRGSVVKDTALLYKERYITANNSIGYEFNLEGLDYTHPSTYSIDNDLMSSIESHLSVDYPLQGRVYGMVMKTNNLLLLENFKYYINMPKYAYSDNATIERFGFMTFVGNSVLVIGWAILAQVFLCSICAFVISRLLSRRAGNYVLLFFLGAMMIPFASIMLPQLIMYRSMGAYNNYIALLLPFLYPYGFYVYLYKGFFDQIPSSYFEAAKLDGAGSFYLYNRICMPLSKAIISLIALQTFISNWNDFFWAWLVTEDQNLWTLNVALYNLSNNQGTKQNSIMGLSIVTIIPVVLASIIFSKQLKQSIMASGVKG